MIQEAQLLRTLQSTHVIHLHEYAFEGNKVYIVMEYAPNGTLTALIQVCTIIHFIYFLSL